MPDGPPQDLVKHAPIHLWGALPELPHTAKTATHRRTASARMFVRQPELLVFDDLSSALDVETERTLWGASLGRRGCHLTGCLPSPHGFTAG